MVGRSNPWIAQEDGVMIMKDLLAKIHEPIRGIEHLVENMYASVES